MPPFALPAWTTSKSSTWATLSSSPIRKPSLSRSRKRSTELRRNELSVRETHECNASERSHNTNHTMKPYPTRSRPCQRSRWLAAILLGMAFGPVRAHASIFKGEALDTAADVLTWVVLVVAPIVAIAVFLLIHILPEKIAEKKQHPQAKAIQCLCLLSLAFGGLLWPLAWLWAYTKPVLYKMAYGADKTTNGHEKEVVMKGNA